MADYTIKNVKQDLEDQAPKFGMEGVEARFGRRALGLDKLGFSYQRLDPDVRLPFGHRHAEQEEVYIVLEGSGRIKIEDEVHDISQWDAIRVAPGTTRAIESGSDGIAFLACGAPVFEESDVEMIRGWW
jgi:uncharacterized cupin superfamily protein